MREEFIEECPKCGTVYNAEKDEDCPKCKRDKEEEEPVFGSFPYVPGDPFW